MHFWIWNMHRNVDAVLKQGFQLPLATAALANLTIDDA
jgi:hypothetical protein